MKRTILAIIALVAVAPLTTTVRAQNLVAKWANTTTITAANQTYVNGMGYNPKTGDLIVSMCAGAASATIYTFKSTDGTASSPATLSTTGLPTTGHTYMIGGLTVASDGTIYACSYNGASTQKIYSWANESSTPTVLCTWAYTGAGSIGKNLSVYGTGNGAVFLLTGSSTTVIYVYYTGSAWAQKVVTVGSQSCQSDCAFVNWSSSSCQFITKNSSANGYSTTFNPSSGSPITASQTAITGFASGSGSIHNLAYDPITKLIGTYTRTATASPWAITANTWTAGYPSGTLTAPTAQTPISVNTSAVDTGNIGANCWGSGTWQGIYYCGPATTGGYGVRAYDTTAFKVTDTTPTGPVVVTAGASPQAFSVVSGGSGLTYQWQVNTGSGYGSVPAAGDFSGGTTATLTINPTTTADSGSYQCVVNGVNGSKWTSTPATLTVNSPCTPPSVGPVTPSSQTLCAGSSPSFSVPTPTGTSPFTYQWQVNKGGGYANVSGSEYGATGTAATLTINPLATGDAGSYQCVVTGQCSPTATATAGTLTVHPAPTASAITGSGVVAINQLGKTYSVTPATIGSGYVWSVPTGASITAGQGTASITVNFGSASGSVAVTETTAAGCGGAPVSLPVTVGPNHAPVAPAAQTLSTARNTPALYAYVKLLANATDVDSDTLTVTAAAASPACPSGTTVAVDDTDGGVLYTPAPYFTGSDTYTYTISDGNGGTALGTVNVTVTAPPSGASLNIVAGPTYDAVSGKFSITFAGIPGITYQVNYATSPTGPWSPLHTVTASLTDGLVTVTDTEASSPSRYYQMVYP